MRPNDCDDKEKSETNRRTLLAVVMGGASLLLAGIIGIPAALAVCTPALRRGRRNPWRSVGRLDDFQVGTVKRAVISVGRGDWARSLDEKAVYVVRQSEQDVVVFSRNCTDLSCPVHFDAGSECFFCPCHGGIFDKLGNPLAGPPKLPLYRYALRHRDGMVEIDLDSLPPMT